MSPYNIIPSKKQCHLKMFVLKYANSLLCQLWEGGGDRACKAFFPHFQKHYLKFFKRTMEEYSTFQYKSSALHEV